MPLIPFDEVSRRLALSRRTYLGLQEIPVDRIVGSVDRSADFRRDFKPQRRLSRGRLANLRTAFPDGVMPAINVFEVGGAYFLEDRHHRVALARERGADYIDAEVTRLETRYEIAPDTDIAQLIHTEQQRELLDASGLSRARPGAVIEFTFVAGYTQLAEIINAHGYELARRVGELPTPEQVAADWYETVYLPGLDAVRRAGLPELYASWNPTDADLFLWVYKIRRDLRGQDAAIDFDAAAAHARGIKHHERSSVRSCAKAADRYRDEHLTNGGIDHMSIIIVGAGPNLGAAIARRFGREGMPVGLVSRGREKLERLAEDLGQNGINADVAPADIRDATALASAIGSLADRLGAIEVLEYSPVPAGEYMKPVLDTTVDDVRASLEFSVLGAVAAVTTVVGPMLERGSGTILFTTGGAAINPNPARTGVGISFAGEVAYARMLHDELRARGIHVGHTAIGGSIAPNGDHHPDDVAEVLWRHHAERRDFQVRLGIS